MYMYVYVWDLQQESEVLLISRLKQKKCIDRPIPPPFHNIRWRMETDFTSPTWKNMYWLEPGKFGESFIIEMSINYSSRHLVYRWGLRPFSDRYFHSVAYPDSVSQFWILHNTKHHIAWHRDLRQLASWLYLCF